jgi:hypothetical protein
MATLVTILIFLYMLFTSSSHGAWVGALGLGLAMTTWLFPKFLELPTKLWIGVGVVMAKISNPLILGVLFYLVLSPIALVLRLFRRDVLSIRKSRTNTWEALEKPDYAGNYFERQF